MKAAFIKNGRRNLSELCKVGNVAAEFNMLSVGE